MEILLASGNAHKKREIQEVLADHKILIPRDLSIEFEYEETGSTFLDNAVGKAMHLNNLVGKPVIADDSGLVVPALGGDPGVRSARYGDDTAIKPLNDVDRYELLLKKMTGIEDRRASFICCMVLCLDDLRFYVVQERFDGTIAHEPSGSGGFGYDPVFTVPEEGVTVAEMSADAKNEISHRGKAIKRMCPLLDQIQDQIP